MRPKATHKTCTKCKERKEVSAFYSTKYRHKKKDGTYSHYEYRRPKCKACWDIESRQWFRENWLEHLVHQARNRAKKSGVPFDITANDIHVPELCPLLQIPIRQNLGANAPCDNSPSLDRIIPELGYVRGNVMLISYKANKMKSNATKEELVVFSENVLRLMRDVKQEEVVL